jgi:hypothetical protein
VSLLCYALHVLGKELNASANTNITLIKPPHGVGFKKSGLYIFVGLLAINGPKLLVFLTNKLKRKIRKF